MAMAQLDPADIAGGYESVSGNKRKQTDETDAIMRDIQQEDQDQAEEDMSKLPFVDRLPFNSFIGFVIIGNAICIGIQANLLSDELRNNPDLLKQQKCGYDKITWYLLDVFFTLAFTIEAFLRLNAHYMKYFHDPWNIIDFILVVTAVVDVFILQLMCAQTSLQIFTVLRIIRLLKLVRLLKVMKVFAQLYMIVRGLSNALRTLFWVCIMLFVGLYTCSVFCTLEIGHQDELYDEYFLRTGWDHEMYFGTVMQSMLTLFQICTRDHWSDRVVRHVISVSPIFSWFFTGFIMVTTYGMLNLVVGVIVERILAMSKMNKEKDYKKHVRDKTVALNHLKSAFQYMDEDGSGTLTLEELETAIINPEISSRLKMIGFPTDDPQKIFMLLDVEHTGSLPLEQFIKGCTRISGQAASKDLLEVLVSVATLGKQLDNLEDRVELMHHKVGLLDGKTANMMRQAGEMFSDSREKKKLKG